MFIPYSGKVWQAECLANLLFSSVWQKKVWRMNRSAKGLSMVTINLGGFSLANCRRFAKFAKLSPRQAFPLHSMLHSPNFPIAKVFSIWYVTVCCLFLVVTEQSSSSDGGPIKATAPMWRCSRIMHLLRDLHPTLLSALEGIVDQVPVSLHTCFYL